MQRVQEKVQYSTRDYTITIDTGGFDPRRTDYSPEEVAKALAYRWRIVWSCRDSDTGRMRRMPDIKAGVNRIKTIKGRYEFLRMRQKAMIETFEEGYHPMRNEALRSTSPGESAKEAILMAVELKKQLVSEVTYKDYVYVCGKFIEFLQKIGKEAHPVAHITRKDVVHYLDQVLARTSAGTRNTHRKVLSGLWTVLVEQELVPTNFIRNDIAKARGRVRVDKTISPEKLEQVALHLAEKDPVLLLFIKMVAYNFLRPIEVCRLRVKDVDITGRQIYFDQKTKLGKTKRIPELYLKELASHIEGSQPEDLLFTPSRRPGPWDQSEVDRRKYWGRAFVKARKRLGMGLEVKLYNFRHTYITSLYKSIRSNGLGEMDALGQLQRITGHESIQGLKNYIHAHDAERPEDWSDLIEVRL